MVDGLVIRGRLIKVSEGEAYTGKNADGALVEKVGRPSCILLCGDDSLRVEFQDVAARDAALLALFGEKVPKMTPAGLCTDMPEVLLPVRAFGPWDRQSRTFGEVRYGGR